MPVDDTGSAERKAAIGAMMAEFGAVFRELRCIGSERLVKQGVSMTHLHVIAMLARHGAMPMSRLAELLDVSLSNATGLVDRMEERGFVERFRVPEDRRIVLVRVTERGSQLETEMEFLKGELLEKVLGRMDTAQIERLVVAIRDFRDAVTGVLGSEPSTAWHWHAHQAEKHPVISSGQPEPSPGAALAG